MALTTEIEEAARLLGESLRAHAVTRAFLVASQRVESDPEASSLEKEMYSTYEALIARQQAGETIPREEVEAFYALRTRVFNHPLVKERENARQPLKSFFAEVATEISAHLGLDYSTLVQK